MKIVQLAVLTTLVTLSCATIDDKCLNCICQVESGCDEHIGCIWNVGSYSCGPYQIKEEYYAECSIDGNVGDDWQNCANSLSCAEQCVRNYLNRYGTHCTKEETPTCQDHARIHKGGPNGCQDAITLPYGEKVNSCYIEAT